MMLTRLREIVSRGERKPVDWPPPDRYWYRTAEGTFYRNCPMIAAERDEAMDWPTGVPNKWAVVDTLMDEWMDTYRHGVQRTDRLGPHETAIEAAA